MRRLTPLPLLLALALTGCGGGDTNAAAPLVASPDTSAAAPASPSPSAAAPSPAAALDAAAVAKALQAAGVPVEAVRTITAENDPNHLLGRPNGYTSKVEITDKRVAAADRDATGGAENGAGIEVYADAAGA